MSHTCVSDARGLQIYDGQFAIQSTGYDAGRHAYSAAIIDFVSASLPDEGDLLDVGCGTGLGTRQLAVLRPTSQVIGVDADIGMLSRALVHRSPASYVLSDVSRLAWPAGRFAAATAFGAAHWFSNRAYLEIGRVLAPDGIFVAVTRSGSDPVKTAVLRALSPHAGIPLRSRTTSWTNVAKPSNFSKLKETEFTEVLSYTPESFGSWITSLAAWRKIPLRQRSAALRAASACYGSERLVSVHIAVFRNKRATRLGI